MPSYGRSRGNITKLLSGALSKWEASSSSSSASAPSASGARKPQTAATRGQVPQQQGHDDAVCTWCGTEFTKSLGDGPYCAPFCRAAIAGGRPVQLVDLNGKVLQEFPSANATKKLGVTEHDVKMSAQGKSTARLTELGMIFRFKNVEASPSATSPEAAPKLVAPRPPRTKKTAASAGAGPKPHRNPAPFGSDDIVEIHEQASATAFNQEAYWPFLCGPNCELIITTSDSQSLNFSAQPAARRAL